MAYTNFDKQEIVVMNGFEAAAYVASLIDNDGEPWLEGEFDLLMEDGLLRGIIEPPADDQFAQWYVQPVGTVGKYSPSDISSGKQSLYYVPTNTLGDYRNLSNLRKMFSEEWLKRRTYELFYIYIGW